MDPSESLQFDFVSPGEITPPGSCDVSRRLGAYFDGELSSADTLRIEQHLAACDDCRAELNEIRELSLLADRIGAEGMSAGSIRKIHRLVDLEQGYSILRVAGMLTALAASVVIVGSVWLSEIPSHPAGPPRVVMTELDSNEMRYAANVQFDPLPQSSSDIRYQQIYADARLARWTYDGLSGSDR